MDLHGWLPGGIEPVSIAVPLADIFEELRREFSSLAAARNIDLQIRSSASVIATDRALFYQLLPNLLGNALKYTDRGWARVRSLQVAETLDVCIEDSGIGTPEDKLERSFDEYYQVDTHGTKRMGVGLGLATRDRKRGVA